MELRSRLRSSCRTFSCAVLICGTTVVGRGASAADDDNNRGFASFSATAANTTPSLNFAAKTGVALQQLDTHFPGILSNLSGAVSANEIIPDLPPDAIPPWTSPFS